VRPVRPVNQELLKAVVVLIAGIGVEYKAAKMAILHRVESHFASPRSV
jgi:hypothetical protein